MSDNLPEWTIVNEENVNQFLSEFSETDLFSFDVETTGLLVQKPGFTVNCIAFTLDTLKTWVLPLTKNEDPEWGDAVLARVFSRADGKRGIGHNGKYDNMSLMARYGKKFFLYFDTMLASHVVNENTPHDLKHLAKVHCDAPDYDTLTLKEKLGLVGDFNKVLEYNCYDTHYTFQLYKYYKERLKRSFKLRRLFFSLVMPAARIFEEVDYEGMWIDLEKFEKTRIELTINRDRTKAELQKMSGTRKIINWGSPKQVGELLFGKLGLPVTHYTPAGKPSTGESAMIEMSGTHPIADKLIEYRGYEKFLSTYIEGWGELMVGNTLYLSTKLHGTKTGRFSSRLHQVPRSGTIRSLIDAPVEDGWTFICADFSQIEVRLVAHVSQDPQLIYCFKNGIDIHWRTLMDIISMGGGDNVQLSIKTAEMYCLQHGLPAHRTSTEVLSKVWNTSPRREATEEILKKVWGASSAIKSAQNLQEVFDSVQTHRNLPAVLSAMPKGRGQRDNDPESNQAGAESRSRIRGKSAQRQEPLLEGWDFLSVLPREGSEDFLRALWEYIQFRRTSQGSKQSESQAIQFTDALSLVSSLDPQSAQEIDKTWKERRKLGKSVVFGNLYTMSWRKFKIYAKENYGILMSDEEAQNSQQVFFNLYSNIRMWHERAKREVKEWGYVEYISGRMRRLPAIYFKDQMLRAEAERQAINSPIQGFGSGDLKAMAMVGIHEAFDRDTLRIKGEVHDSVLAWVRTDKLEEVLPKVKYIMENPPLFREFKIELSVPLVVDIEVGTWGAGVTWHQKTVAKN